MSSVSGTASFEAPNLEPADTIRIGLGMIPPASSASGSAHAVQAIQANQIAGTVAFKDALAARAFGAHYMLRMQRERVR